jgi:hypothetical protein
VEALRQAAAHVREHFCRLVEEPAAGVQRPVAAPDERR